jgi:hypothetical protein
MHALACDDCKLTPLPDCPEILPLLVSKATADPNARVRRHAQETLRWFSTGHDASVGQPIPG